MGEVLHPKDLQELYVWQGKGRTLAGQHPKKLAADLSPFWNGQLLGTPGHQPLGAYWVKLHPNNSWG